MKRKCLTTAERLERFEQKTLVIPFVDCWLWIGAEFGRPGRKYGVFYDGKHQVSAHRWIYEITIGKIPEELELDHLCRTPLCVRPSHLEPVTHLVNVHRGFSPTAIKMRDRLATGLCFAGHAVADHWDSVRGFCLRCKSDSKKVLESERERRRWTPRELEIITAADRPRDRDLSVSLGRTIIAIKTMRSLYSRNLHRNRT